MKNKLTIGLIGFGCVGQGLYDIISKNTNSLIRIKKIAVKHKNKPRSLPLHYFTFNVQEIINDPEINVIVELIDDADEAYRIVKSSLMKGKAVVTANKKMIAEHLQELIELQKTYQTPLLYEASSCGGIPIIRTLEEYYNNEHLQSIHGIFNGSSNYILTQIFHHGNTYAQALAEAQRLGFAESNPLLDVEGFDAKYKLIILTTHAFGVVISPDDVFNIGISALTPRDLSWIRQAGLVVKLEAKAEIVNNNQLRVSVLPVLITPNSSIGSVLYEFNTVLVKAAFSDQQQFVGKGAGGHPTGSAVLSDIVALHYHYKYEYHKLNQSNHRLAFTNEHSIRVLLRTKKIELIQHMDDSTILYSDNIHGEVVAVGNISLKKLNEYQQVLLANQCFVAELNEYAEFMVRKTLLRNEALKSLTRLISAC
ncbi:MAG: homoserine dehydrogenase [Flavobacteriales bacterium]|nr:homoserine dehydrogenase [Flavobacteriales bacterium]